MKKIKTEVNEKNRIVIDIIGRTKIQYALVDARSGKKTELGCRLIFHFQLKITSVFMEKL